MANASRRIVRLGLTLAGLGLLAGAVALAVRMSGTPPQGPVPVAYDHQTCAQCRMLISEPRFAAQLHTEDARVLHFDDPGCLFRWETEHDVEVRTRYFRHLEEDRWLSGDEVAFFAVRPTPMGYGLGAVERGRERAIPLAEARRRVLARDRSHVDAP